MDGKDIIFHLSPYCWKRSLRSCRGKTGRNIFNNNNNSNSKGLLSTSCVPGTALSPCLLTYSAFEPHRVGIMIIVTLWMRKLRQRAVERLGPSNTVGKGVREICSKEFGCRTCTLGLKALPLLKAWCFTASSVNATPFAFRWLSLHS